MASLFAVIGRFLALKFVEEGELSARDVLHLFPEAADAVVLADCGDIGILVFRHGFGESDKIPFRELERAADAFRDGLGNVILLGGFLGWGVLWLCRFPDSRESDATHDKKGSNTKKGHSSLR